MVRYTKDRKTCRHPRLYIKGLRRRYAVEGKPIYKQAADQLEKLHVRLGGYRVTR